MKHTITFTFLICAFAMNAQTVTFDTTYFTTVNGTLFATERTELEDGSYTERRYTTDTTRILNTTNRNTLNQTTQFANIARQWQDIRRITSQEIRRGDAIRAQIGINPRSTLIDGYAAEFFDSVATWQIIKPGSAATPTTFSLNANGDVRFTDGTNRTAFVLGELIRINNWPASGDVTILYKASPRLWQTMRNDIRFERTDNR